MISLSFLIRIQFQPLSRQYRYRYGSTQFRIRTPSLGSSFLIATMSFIIQKTYGTVQSVFSLMPLPENEGYRYCPPCERWVAATNLHCSLCAACPSKDGRTYRHCTPCGRCVKPTYEHCPQCKRCFLAGGHTGCAEETTSTNSTCKRSAEVAKVTDDDMPEKRKRSREKKRKGKEERE
jgi:hypothetical protein